MFEAFWIGSLIILNTFKRVVDFASRPARKESSVLSIGIRERKEKKKVTARRNDDLEKKARLLHQGQRD